MPHSLGFYLFDDFQTIGCQANLTTVLDELTWDNLTATQWKHLETIRELLKPFAHQTNITSAENSTTIAMVIPVLKELSLHLEEMSKLHGVASISERMLSDLKQRFWFVTDPAALSFDPVYVASTLLSPPYRKLLNSEQEMKAKLFLSELTISNKTSQLTHPIETENCNTLGSTSCNQFENPADGNCEQSQEAEEPPAKRFKHLDRVSKLLEREELDDQENDEVQISKEEHQLDDYMKSKASSEDRGLDPFDY